MTAMYTLKRGGAYDRFLLMIEAFLERNCDVHCLSLTPIFIDHPRYHNWVIALPFKIRNGFVSKAVTLILFPFCSLVMGRRYKIDLIVAFGPLYAFIQVLARWALRKPMVTLVRLETSFRTGMRNILERFFSLNAIFEYIGIMFSDRIIANNLATRDEIIYIVGDQRERDVNVLFNNVLSMAPSSAESLLQVRARLGIPAHGKLMVTAGVITQRKNFEVLLKCFPLIEMSNILLVIIGDAPTKGNSLYLAYLKGLIEELNLEKKVFFTGWVEKEELWRIYRAADLFVLPSLKEGMPNVMLEALGVNLPCIGSNIPGIRDILHYEELMFDPLDEKAISRKVFQFFSDTQVLNRIRGLCQGRKKVFVFDWQEKVCEMVLGHLG